MELVFNFYLLLMKVRNYINAIYHHKNFRKN
jgi:hypothetical protein